MCDHCTGVAAMLHAAEHHAVPDGTEGDGQGLRFVARLWLTLEATKEEPDAEKVQQQLLQMCSDEKDEVLIDALALLGRINAAAMCIGNLVTINLLSRPNDELLKLSKMVQAVTQNIKGGGRGATVHKVKGMVS